MPKFGHQPRYSDRFVHTADGRRMRLTIGEYNTIRAFIAANGRTGVLYPPKGSEMKMTTHLVDMGILQWIGPGRLRWAPGVLELTDPIDEEKFKYEGTAETQQ